MSGYLLCTKFVNKGITTVVLLNLATPLLLYAKFKTHNRQGLQKCNNRGELGLQHREITSWESQWQQLGMGIVGDVLDSCSSLSVSVQHMQEQVNRI